MLFIFIFITLRLHFLLKKFEVRKEKGKEKKYKTFSYLVVHEKFEGRKIKPLRNALSTNFTLLFFKGKWGGIIVDNFFPIFSLGYVWFPKSGKERKKNIKKNYFLMVGCNMEYMFKLNIIKIN